jgi:chromate transport protein ChrA
MIVDVRTTEAAHGVSLKEAFPVWLRVAWLSFGGPAGLISFGGAG